MELNIPLINTDNYYIKEFHPAERDLYDHIVENLRHGILVTELPMRGLNQERIAKIAAAVDFGCPEFFFLNKNYTISVTWKNTLVVEFESIYPVEKLPRMWRQLEERIDDVIYDMSLQTNDVDRILRLNRWFVENCKTEGTVSATNGNAYTALVKGVGRCEGIAKAAQIVLRRLDFRCLLAYGVGGGENHAWNIVGFHGKWYNFDFTWNIGEGGKYYVSEKYLFLPDCFFGKTHVQDTRFVSAFPACTDDAYAFWKRFKTEITSPKDFAKAPLRSQNGRKWNLYYLSFAPSEAQVNSCLCDWLPSSWNIGRFQCSYREEEHTLAIVDLPD